MANNQYNFLDYAGLSLFWNNVKSIIEENELATASALTNLDTRVDNLEASKADKVHTHSKSQITDFPTSLPASDVYSWAKQSTKPPYSFSEITSKPTTITGYGITDSLRRVTLANNVENDFNTFENLTLTGRGDPTTGSSLLNSPWTTQPAGGFGVLTYLWSSYGLQLTAGYSSNDLYIRNKYYTGGGSNWSTKWDKILNSSNYNSYVPSLTGSGASGTWGINISGNAAKIGTSTVGSSTMPVYINAGTPTAISSFPESYLSWGGLPIEGDISPIDAACCSDFNHNKLAFLPADCITVEYTTDGGSTWIDYGASDVQKISLVTSNTAFYIGKRAASAMDGTMTNSNCSNYQVRVTVSSINSSGTHKIYTTSKKLLINISSNGSSGCKIKMETQTIGDYNNNVDTWTTINTYNVAGYSGWNSIPLYFPAGNTFGGFEDQTSKVAKLRLTLSITGVENYTSQASILGLRLIGTSSWINPSIMSETGHLYSYDAYQNASFPGGVTATWFAKSGGTSSQFLKADGSVDSNTYSKSGHTHKGSEVTLTGYSKVSSYSEISASDTVNQAIAKLEYVLSGLEDLLASI